MGARVVVSVDEEVVAAVEDVVEVVILENTIVLHCFRGVS